MKRFGKVKETAANFEGYERLVLNQLSTADLNEGLADQLERWQNLITMQVPVPPSVLTKILASDCQLEKCRQTILAFKRNRNLD